MSRYCRTAVGALVFERPIRQGGIDREFDSILCRFREANPTIVLRKQETQDRTIREVLAEGIADVVFVFNDSVELYDRELAEQEEGRAANLTTPHEAGNRGQTPRCSAREAGGPRYRCRRIAWNSSSASLLTAAMTVSPGMSTVLPLIISSPSSSSTAMSCTSLLKGMFATWMPSR